MRGAEHPFGEYSGRRRRKIRPSTLVSRLRGMTLVNVGCFARRYYYENFYSLGKRPPEPDEPARQPGQARVSCDEYDSGSCRAYGMF